MFLMLIGRIEKVEAPKEAPKDGREWWYAECPAIGAYTQGHSRNDARFMLADCVECCVHRRGFKVRVLEVGRTAKGFSVVIDANRREQLAAYMLLFQRSIHKMTRETVAQRAGLEVATYAAYEEGHAIPSLDTLGALLEIIAPELALIVGPRVVPASKAPRRKRVTRRRRRRAA
jgi:transcriptional regulator with XRE-family HTH domain